MPKQTWNPSVSSVSSGDYTFSWNRSSWSSIIAKIPKYSTISSVYLTMVYEGSYSALIGNSGGFKADAYLNSTLLSSKEYTKKGQYTVSNLSLLGYTYSNNSNSGYITGDLSARLQSRAGSYLIQTLKATPKIEWTYTNPTYKINISATEGGTVSGDSGTFEITTTDSVKTVKATVNNGYRFVGWINNDTGNIVSTNASYSITLSHNSISAHSTTLSLTAQFEKIIAVTDLQLSANNLNIKLSEKINHIYSYIDNLSDYFFQSSIVKNGNCELSSKYVALKATEENCYISPYQESHLVPQIEYLFKIKPNQDYTYTMTMKSLENAETTMYVFYYDNNYNFLTYHNSNRSSEETQIYNWISPENAAYAGLRFDNHNINTKIYFSNVYVYEGKVYNIYNKIDLIEIISPENADNTAVKWNSSNPSVIYISEDTGEMLIQDFGTTIITCTARDDTNGQISAQCVINILPHYEGPKAYLGTTPVKIYFGNDLITNYHFFLS